MEQIATRDEQVLKALRAYEGSYFFLIYKGQERFGADGGILSTVYKIESIDASRLEVVVSGSSRDRNETVTLPFRDITEVSQIVVP